MKYLLKRHKPLADVIKYFIKSIRNYDTLSINEKCEMLLCFKVLNIKHDLLEKKLQEVNDYDVSDDNIVKVLKRHLVLVVFELNKKERLQFVKYWLSDGFYKNEDIVTVSWIFGMLADDMNLLDESQKNELKLKLKKLSKNIKSQTSLSWMPFHLEKFGYYDLASDIINELISNTESNGSWVGNVSRTTRILHAISKSKSSKNKDFSKSFNFIEKRLQKGIDLDAKLVTQIIKLYYITNKLGIDFRDLIIEKLHSNTTDQISMVMSLLGKNKIDQALKFVEVNNLIPFTESTLIKSRISNINDTFNKGFISVEQKDIERQRKDQYWYGRCL